MTEKEHKAAGYIKDSTERLYIDAVDAQTIADDSNYLTCGDKHYCPNCYSVNDDDNYF